MLIPRSDSSGRAFVPCDAPAPESRPNEEKTDTAANLENISRRVLGFIRDRDFTHPEISKYMVPNYISYMEHTTELPFTTREQLLAYYQQLAEEDPSYRFDIHDVTADEINEEKGTAMVWIRCNVRLYGTQQQSLTRVYWEAVNGNWRCFMQYRMRGIATI